MMRNAMLLGLLLVGCGPNLATSEEFDDAVVLDDAELAGELKAQVPSLTVWVRPTLTPEQRDGRLVYVLKGRTSQNLVDVNSYVFDDPMGFATVLTPRTFEIVFDGNSELNTMAAGMRLFLGITTTGSNPRATASFTLQPAFTSPTGSTSIWVRSEVLPVAVGERLAYRVRSRTTAGAPLTITTAANGESWTSTRRAGTTDEWNTDLTFEQLRGACDEAGEKVTFKTTTSTGVKTKTLALGVAVKTVELTRADVETTWPPVQCAATVQSCLDALPAGATDAESCGTWYQVSRCQLPWRGASLFPSPDDLTALTTATGQVNDQLPHWKQAAFRAYGVNGVSSPSAIAKVLAAWKVTEPYGDLVDAGAVTAGQLNTQLAAFGNAQRLVPAAQQVVYQQSFTAWRFTRGAGVSLYALYFASAARLVILETTELVP